MTFLFAMLAGLISGCNRTNNNTAPDEIKTLAGRWSDTKEEPLGMFLDLRRDGTFVMGDIDKGEYFAGLFGTWEIKDNRIFLKITKSESCKVQVGQVLDWAFALIADGRLVLKSPDGNDRWVMIRSTQPATRSRNESGGPQEYYTVEDSNL